MIDQTDTTGTGSSTGAGASFGSSAGGSGNAPVPAFAPPRNANVATPLICGSEAMAAIADAIEAASHEVTDLGSSFPNSTSEM